MSIMQYNGGLSRSPAELAAAASSPLALLRLQRADALSYSPPSPRPTPRPTARRLVLAPVARCPSPSLPPPRTRPPPSGSVIAMVGKDCVAIASDLRLGNQAMLVAGNFEKVRCPSPLCALCDPACACWSGATGGLEGRGWWRPAASGAGPPPRDGRRLAPAVEPLQLERTPQSRAWASADRVRWAGARDERLGCHRGFHRVGQRC